MLTLRLDSHMLSDFQLCKEKGNLAHVHGYRTKSTQQGINRGTCWHQLMEYRAEFKQEKISWGDVLTKSTAYLFEAGIEPDEIGFYIEKLSNYHARWASEEEGWIFKASEIGFSKVLWENHEIRFVYEGKIDAIIGIPNNRGDIQWIFVDHKTQHPGFSGIRYNLFPHGNQFLGYSWATKYTMFMIDYTTWSKSTTENTFRRIPYMIPSDIVDQWKEDTIASYWEILQAIRFSKYPLTRAACDGKYGICQFADVCGYTDSRAKLITLETKFNKEPRWNPWEEE